MNSNNTTFNNLLHVCLMENNSKEGYKRRNQLRLSIYFYIQLTLFSTALRSRYNLQQDFSLYRYVTMVLFKLVI